MTKGIFAGAALAALVSVSAAEAQTCDSGCTARHTACTQAGKDYATCMGVWRQCRMACVAPARTVSVAPRTTQVVARR